MPHGSYLVERKRSSGDAALFSCAFASDRSLSPTMCAIQNETAARARTLSTAMLSREGIQGTECASLGLRRSGGIT